MNRLSPGLRIAGCAFVAASCTAESSPAPDTTTSEDTGSYVLLLDDGSEQDQAKGEPGTYAMTARGGGAPPLAVVDVPAGYSNFGSFALWPYQSAERTDEEPFRAVQYWTVSGVYPDPCRRGGAAPEIGPGVGDLVAALRAQRRTEVSGRTQVSLDGHAGVALDLDVPGDLAVERCTEGRYMFWEGEPGDAHHQAEPQAVERVWILDIAGQRVVLAALAAPEVPANDWEDVTAIIESVRFVEPQ
jgi:hypothetical protein